MAAKKINLQPNEVVLLQEKGVKHGGFWANYTDELVLTNLNLILSKRGMMGNSKGTFTFPLSEIKVHNGQAQALLGESANRTPQLQVYFVGGQENFEFQSGKRTAVKWASKINDTVTGSVTPVDEGPASVLSAIPGAEALADTLGDTINVFKNKFRSAPKVVPVSTQCHGCGAPASGHQGSVVVCEYCGARQTL